MGFFYLKKKKKTTAIVVKVSSLYLYFKPVGHLIYSKRPPLIRNEMVRDTSTALRLDDNITLLPSASATSQFY